MDEYLAIPGIAHLKVRSVWSSRFTVARSFIAEEKPFMAFDMFGLPDIDEFTWELKPFINPEKSDCQVPTNRGSACLHPTAMTSAAANTTPCLKYLPTLWVRTSINRGFANT